jgi:hypothetical protein
MPKSKTTNDSNLFIQAEIAIPLGELAIYMKVNESKIVSALYHQWDEVKDKIKDTVKEALNKRDKETKLISLLLEYLDSENIDYGVAYFSVILEGKESALREIAGDEDNLFQFDWIEGKKSVVPLELTSTQN